MAVILCHRLGISTQFPEPFRGKCRSIYLLAKDTLRSQNNTDVRKFGATPGAIRHPSGFLGTYKLQMRCYGMRFDRRRVIKRWMDPPDKIIPDVDARDDRSLSFTQLPPGVPPIFGSPSLAAYGYRR